MGGVTLLLKAAIFIVESGIKQPMLQDEFECECFIIMGVSVLVETLLNF